MLIRLMGHCLRYCYRLGFSHQSLMLNLVFLSITSIYSSARSQNLPTVPIPDPITPKQPQILQPPLQPDEPLQISPSIPTSPTQIPDSFQTFTVKGFEFVGLTESVFSQDTLRKKLCAYKRKLTFTELLSAAAEITELYISKGYETSGAYIPEQTFKDGIVKIQIVEGSLQETRISRKYKTPKRLTDDYVRSRLDLATTKPLNVERLKSALQLLQLDPLIQSISAELSAGTTPGTNILRIQIHEANTFSSKILIDNSRNPSVGSLRRRLQAKQANVTGLGDQLNLSYDNTDGSNSIDANYTIPINPHNGTVSFAYSNTLSNIIEPPFEKLDIESSYRNYEITLRQPIFQSAEQKSNQELALGLTLTRRETDTSVLGVNFPISVGADAQGTTRISALRFFQEYQQSSLQEVLLARSQFSLGIGTFDATINEKAPDSRFFAWRGQLSWLRLLGTETDNPKTTPKFLFRSDVQLATTTLLPLEQMTLGGTFSIRGYRQDAVFRDNGIAISADLQIPIYNSNEGENILQLIPFIDIGTAWKTSQTNTANSTTLAGIGLGLQWEMGENFKARLDYGIPLFEINSTDRTLQEKGLYFSMEYNPF
jgi:hemolysin activation/secretion protein